MQEEDIASVVKKALDDALRERGHMNVLIAGRSGVGKSTLINAVFQGNMAETGQGRPVTQNTREITKEGVPLTIWDTRGLEMASFNETVTSLTRLIKERTSDRDPNRHIHAAWLCIQEDGRRVEEAESTLHSALAEHVPVLGVITKARADGGFRAEVQRLLSAARNVIRVRSLTEQLDDGHVLSPMGLDTLVTATAEVIPEGQRRAFAAAQKASSELKKKESRKIVVSAASAAAACGASPIPFSDAFIIVPIQIGMLACISSTFGLELSKAFLSTLVASAAGTMGATYVGRAIVSNLLKLLPGAGTVAGAAISGTTAAALTTTIVEVYLSTLAALTAKSGGEPPSVDAVASEFRRRLTGGASSEVDSGT